MKVGMLWYDDSEKSLQKIVQEAVKHYFAKYSRQPTMCHIHPKDAGNHFVDPENKSVELPEIVTNGTTIRQDNTVLRHHYWIGFKMSAT